jgi:hypothetical protein
MVIYHLKAENLIHISSNHQHGFSWAPYFTENFVGPSTAEWEMYWVLYTNATGTRCCIQLDILYKYNR